MIKLKNLFRFKTIFLENSFLFKQRFQFSEEVLEHFTDIFKRKEAEDQNKKYSTGK